jgi:hypothetical protein
MDEVDKIEDMQQLARQKWRERALRLKLIDHEQILSQSEGLSGK